MSQAGNSNCKSCRSTSFLTVTVSYSYLYVGTVLLMLQSNAGENGQVDVLLLQCCSTSNSKCTLLLSSRQMRVGKRTVSYSYS
jgi:hypothetical protein